MNVLANELVAACNARDRATICSILESIPKERWHVIPGRADVDLGPLSASGRSGINTYDKVHVQVILDEENHHHFAYTFTHAQLHPVRSAFSPFPAPNRRPRPFQSPLPMDLHGLESADHNDTKAVSAVPI